MYFVPNELIRQFESFSILIHIMFKDLITILVSYSNQGTLTMYDFKTELECLEKSLALDYTI